MRSQAILGTLCLLGCTDAPRSMLPLPNADQDMAVTSSPDLLGFDGGTFQPMAPVITTVSPKLASTASGTQITITGDNFSPSSLFFINNILVNVMSVSKTQAVLLLPPRAGVGPAQIVVRNPDGRTVTNTMGLTLYASQLNFSQTQYSTFANQPRGAAFGDLNGDGATDVIVTHVSQATYTIFLGNGTGGFVPLRDAVAGGPTFGTIGGQAANQTGKLVDLNNDNKLDLVMVTNSNNMHYYLGNGAGPVNQIASNNYGTSATPVQYATLDFNGDNFQDVVTANTGSSNIGLFFNSQNQNNLFSSGQYQVLNPGGQPTRVFNTDIDGDNKQDLITVMQNSGGPTLAVYFGTGTQATPFTAANPLTYGTNGQNQTPQWFDIGDLNGDGKVDVVVSDFNTNTIRVFLGNGTTANTFQTPLAPIPVGLNPQQLAIGDFDGDGKADVVVCNLNSHNVSVLPGKGDGTFGKAQDFTSVNGPYAVYVLDFNGDKRPDFAVVNQQNGGFGTSPGFLTIYLNTSQ